LKEELSKMTGKEIYVDIVEIKTPEIEAQLVAENVALQLERRVSFRRAMKKALQTAKDFGAEGIKIRCAGRLGGADLLASSNITGVESPSTHSAQILITALPKPILSMANWASNAGSAKVSKRSKSLNSARLNPSPPDQIYDLTFQRLTI